MDIEENETLQALLDATDSCRWSYENDSGTLYNNIKYLDRTSPIVDKYCDNLLHYLVRSVCTYEFDAAESDVRRLL